MNGRRAAVRGRRRQKCRGCERPTTVYVWVGQYAVPYCSKCAREVHPGAPKALTPEQAWARWGGNER